MSSNGDGRAHLVHEARKTIKRMRALARLLRRETGEPEFRRVDGALREAGRRLAGARDATVLAATLGDLRKRHGDELDGRPVERLAERLRQAAADADSTERASLDRTALADIERMRGELLLWNLLEHALADGLRLIYRSGRRRYKRAQRSHGRDPERMHDWRKRVKSLYYALDMLGADEAPTTASLTRRANRLGDLLGHEHDLWMLASFLERDSELVEEDARALLLELIERRRERLRGRALALGARVYARKPKRFAARL